MGGGCFGFGGGLGGGGVAGAQGEGYDLVEEAGEFLDGGRGGAVLPGGERGGAYPHELGKTVGGRVRKLDGSRKVKNAINFGFSLDIYGIFD